MSSSIGALGEHQQVGVAAGADRRIGAQRAVGGVVLAGREELAFILRPRLGVAALPGGVELEERELDERALGHAARNSRSARAARRSRRSPARARRRRRGPAASRRVTIARAARRRRRSRSSAAVAGVVAGRAQRRDRRVVPAARPTSTSARATASSPSLYDDGRCRSCVTATGRGARRLGRGRRPRRGRPGGHRARACSPRRWSDAGIPIAGASRSAGTPALIAADEDGRVARTSRGVPAAAARAGSPSSGRARASSPRHGRGARGRRPADRDRAPAAAERARLLASGSPARASSGTLTSDTTRTDGFVLSTDLAPTILDRFGVDVPDEMNGQPIERRGRRRRRRGRSRRAPIGSRSAGRRGAGDRRSTC